MALHGQSLVALLTQEVARSRTSLQALSTPYPVPAPSKGSWRTLFGCWGGLTVVGLVGEVIAELGWPYETKVTFDYRRAQRTLRLDVRLLTLAQMGLALPVISTNPLAVRWVALQPRERNEIYLRYVHCVTLRLIDTMFTEIAPVETVLLVAITKQPTDKAEEPRASCLLACEAGRAQWRKLADDARRDAVEALTHFGLRRCIGAGAALEPINLPA